MCTVCCLLGMSVISKSDFVDFQFSMICIYGFYSLSPSGIFDIFALILVLLFSCIFVVSIPSTYRLVKAHWERFVSLSVSWSLMPPFSAYIQLQKRWLLGTQTRCVGPFSTQCIGFILFSLRHCGDVYVGSDISAHSRFPELPQRQTIIITSPVSQ